MSRQTSTNITLKNLEMCFICSRPVKVMCMKNTGVCSELCRKARDREPNRPQAISNR